MKPHTIKPSPLAAECRRLACRSTFQPRTHGFAPASRLLLLLVLELAASASAQTVPTPDWLARALTNRPQFAPATNALPSRPATNAASPGTAGAPSARVGGLSEQDVAMANAVIAENTLTLSLPGLGTSVDGPGPLTEADRLVLLALKFYHQRKALVPFGEFHERLAPLDSQERFRQVAEEFWAWYREAAGKNQADQLGGYKSEFSTYIAMKNTARRRAANKRIEGYVASEVAWRRAMDSDRRTRERSAQRADEAQKAREERLRDWNVQAAEAAAAEQEWQLYLSHGSGHMKDP